ncbi:MAG TPA: hypothetical protein PL045_11835 [Chitinophagaceae bacterium]|nr:hypothetical protein [Chitinophagaceae bacterium]
MSQAANYIASPVASHTCAVGLLVANVATAAQSFKAQECDATKA